MLTYVTYDQDLPITFCDGLVQMSRHFDQVEAEISRDGNQVLMDEVRNTRISWLNNKEINDILYFYAVKANTDANWNFDLAASEVPQVSFYEKGNFYDWHYDTGSEEADEDLQRKITVTVTLKDDYKGGDLQVQKWVHPQETDNFSTIKSMRNIGSVCVFPSYIFHRVNKVHSGERVALTSWFRGRKFS
jgi:PKHD-type hydroxylase|tara:strand:+ start:909 stop:1475 length:567 start_codon:yes stop_codon:yes gene_type:complete